MDFSIKDFQVLDALGDHEITTQRQLSEKTGISLGQVNFVLKSLLEKGLVKIGNFRQSQNKIGYAYLLTSKGFETKSRLAVDFVTSKLKEYRNLKQRLADRLIGIEQKGHSRIVFIGPEIVKEVITSIIKENKLNLIIVDQFNTIKEFEDCTKPYDAILQFDGNEKRKKRNQKTSDTPIDKMIPLW